MKNHCCVKPYKVFLFVLFFFLSYPSYGQNIVLNVAGKVLVNGVPVKKGDNLSNDQKLEFAGPDAELKLLSQVGVCVIRHKNHAQKSNSELLDLVKSCIRKNSVATLGTRDWKINPGKDEQLRLVEALCKTLDVTPGNADELFSQYITPYCVLEFETPYWQDIARLMQTKYGYDPPQLTGELMTSEAYQNIPLVPKTRSLAPLPPAASLKKYAPIPGNQGQYGTCTGWASAYAGRTISWAVANNLTDVQDITNQAFSPSFVYARIKNDDDLNCQNGARTDASVEILKKEGVVFLSDLPYQCNPSVAPFLRQAKAYAIKDYQRLTAGTGIKSEDDLNNIKRALANKQPVLCSMKCYDSFTNARGKNVWNGTRDGWRGNHAVCLIGYDDHFDNGDGTSGAVELINSWGVTWGAGGFIHIKYRDLPNVLNYAISLYDDVRPVPQPEPPKPLPVPPVPPDTMKRMEGSFSLILRDGTPMPSEGDEAAFRNLRLASAEQMTYNLLHTYSAGTMFRINFTSSQPAYIYVISTDSKRTPLAQLFPDPDARTSALLDFKSEVSVSIPDETHYIQLDETPGEDYLCVIYSKEPLSIDAIRTSLQNKPNESFIKIVKEALAGNIAAGNEVSFEKNKIAFKAASATHTAVPVFVKIKHK